jgi:phosphate transport system substrate-binding protein
MFGSKNDPYRFLTGHPMKILILIPFISVWIALGGCSSAETSVELLAAGATFPYPLYSKVFYEYWKATGVKINYQPIGSGGGQRQLLKKTVDFGGSDAFMSDEAMKNAPAEVLHIPTCAGAVAVTYNLPGSPQLRLSPHQIAEIFLGKITRWNDERLTAINPATDLPDSDIVVVHRSEGSGTTFVFTDYLSKADEQWKTAVGKGKAVNWPVGLGSKGNAGVAGLVKYSPGAIGYVEFGYALLNDMPVALLQNRSGRFVQPDTTSVSVAADVSLPEDTRISLTNTEALEGYPITSFTWILVFKEQAYQQRPKDKARALVKALWWMIHDGQKYTVPLHYAPLPTKAREKAEMLIKAMTHDGAPLFNDNKAL